MSTLAKALVAFSVFAAALGQVLGCLPGENPTIVSQSIFPVFEPTGDLTNLTLTYFTCPSRHSQVERGQRVRPDWDYSEPRAAPIDVCGIMDSSAVFASTFSCNQAAGDQPTLADCAEITNTITDNLIRPMMVTIPALSGLAMSLLSNVFLNDDMDDTYETCLHTISDMNFDIMEECPGPVRDGFIGSVRSLIQPGVQNWEVQYADFLFFISAALTML
ncbi:hypothetical protein DFH06DRAFT_1255882 [Mycena polygramma]|nr:hypothetical protein DFH06DRAFT_1255882 [Mycena polygramma]